MARPAEYRDIPAWARQVFPGRLVMHAIRQSLESPYLLCQGDNRAEERDYRASSHNANHYY